MNYKPSYPGELISPSGSPAAPSPESIVDLSDSPRTAEPDQQPVAQASAPEQPAGKPVFEFVDLDAPDAAGTPEPLIAHPAALETECSPPSFEQLFVDLDELDTPAPATSPEALAPRHGSHEDLGEAVPAHPESVAAPDVPEAAPRQTPEDPVAEIAADPVQHVEPVVQLEATAIPKRIPAPRPSLAVRGVEDVQKAPRRVAMQQAINSWTVASGVLKMIIMHPGYASSLDDKLAGIDVTRHALDQAAAKLEDALGFPKTEGSRQKAKRHLLPVMESVWGYLFSHAPADVNIDQVVGFATKFLEESANLLSADPDELFLRSDRNLDLAMARLTAMTRVQCELQPIFDVIDKYSQKNPTISKIFFGDMNRRAVLDDVFKLVEDVANSFEEGVDFTHLDERDRTIVRRVVLRQSVDLMSGILRSESVMAKLSMFAKEAPKKEGVLKDWITSQYAEWTEGMPSLAAMVESQIREQGLSENRKGPSFS